jgi:hypothetical protein
MLERGQDNTQEVDCNTQEVDYKLLQLAEHRSNHHLYNPH